MTIHSCLFASTAFVAAALTLALAAPAAAAPARMLSCSGAPCAEVGLAGGKTLKLAIDTGDYNSVLDLAAAKAAGLDVVPYVDASGKPAPGYYRATLKDVRLGDESLGDIRVLVEDLGAGLADGTMAKADGTLAYTAFKGRRLVMDFRRHTIAAAPSRGAGCAEPCGAISYPTFGKRGPPIVVSTGFAVNGEPVTMQVDSLYAGTMLIYDTSVEKLGLAGQSATPSVRHFPLTDGGVDMGEGRAAYETFEGRALAKGAPLYFARPGVHQPDGMFDGTVGFGLFKDRVVSFDFDSNSFWMD